MSDAVAEAPKPPPAPLPTGISPIGTPRNTLPQDDYMVWLRIAFRELHQRLDILESKVQHLTNKVRG